MFTDLLVSSPRPVGGLFWIDQGQVKPLWGMSTCGLYYRTTSDTLYLGVAEVGRVYSLDAYLAMLLEPAPAIHDILEYQGHLYLAVTRSNSIVSIAPNGQVQRWVFAREPDAMHLNCLGIWNDRLVFSAFGDFAETRGWNGKAAGQGFVQDLYSGQKLITGLSGPHHPVQWGSNLLVANSGTDELHEYAPDGQLVRKKYIGHFVRGVCLANGVLYLGTNCKRGSRDDASHTTLYALDPHTWETLGQIDIPSREIYGILCINSPARLAEMARTLALEGFYAYRTLSAQHAALQRELARRSRPLSWLPQPIRKILARGARRLPKRLQQALLGLLRS